MTAKEYEAYLAKMNKIRMNEKAVKPPLPRVREVSGSKWSQPERRYFYGVLRGVGRYEACRLRITPDYCEEHVYTPDFTTEHVDKIDIGGHVISKTVRVHHEVKGSYRLGSQDGARLRWTFAAIAHPEDVFVWAKESRRKGLWDIEIWGLGGIDREKARGVRGFKFSEDGSVVWEM